MGKQRNTTLILGEGPTEFFYFKSLCDELKGLTIKPDYPNHTQAEVKGLCRFVSQGETKCFSA